MLTGTSSLSTRPLSISLPGYDSDSDPEEEELLPATCWDRWKERASLITGIGIGALSLAIRIANLSPWSNALASVGMGISAQQLIEWYCPSDPPGRLLKLRKATATMFSGQSEIYAASQLRANVTPIATSGTASSFVVITLGANLCMVVKELGKNRFRIERETRPMLLEEGVCHIKLERVFFNQNPKDLLRVLFIAASTIGGVEIDGEIMPALAKTFATYFSGQIAGDRLMNFVDKKVAQADDKEIGVEFTDQKGSWWRYIKTGLLTSAYVAIPFAFFPYNGALQTAKRIAQLLFVGGGVGVADGLLLQSLENRVRSVSLPELSELQLVPESRLGYITSVVWPALVTTGFFFFGGWQVLWGLTTTAQKIAMGLTFGGYALGFGAGTLIDRHWDKEKRIEAEQFLRREGKNCVEKVKAFWILTKDRLAYDLLLAQRLLIFPPAAYIYFFITNAVPLNSLALAGDETEEERSVILAGWFCYGLAWGLELLRTGGRRWGVGQQLPMMAFINGVFTLINVWKGDVP